MADYDLAGAFGAIENELIASMMRNFQNHRAEETALGLNWTQWQVEQLNALEKYRINNQKKFGKQFENINGRITQLIRDNYSDGQTKQERKILQAIKRGYKINGTNKPAFTGKAQTTGEFFGVNDRKLEALITATTHDMEKAETAVLRLANDQYRKAIFNAQVYANAGGTNYQKAVDMAVKDMLNAGLNCVEYKNGARHTLSSYADMALRTATTRAYLQGEGAKRKEWGISTVILNKRSCPCPKCLPFVGKVFVDDVWSGGTAEEAKEKGYPLLSTAIEQGLYHPNCKDTHTTYFEGISTPPEKPTAEEKEKAVEDYNQEQKACYNAQQAKKCERISKYSLDNENKRVYKARAEQWREKEKSLKVVANSGESGIMELRDNGSLYKPITKESINKVPKLNIFSDDTLNSLHQQASKDLLSEVSKHKPVGVEVSRVYDKNMKPIKGCGYVVGRVGSVKIDNPNVPYHAFHNHGSGETFSVEDLINFTKRDNMLSLSACGNNGSIYCILRTSKSNSEIYADFLKQKTQEKFFGNNGKLYSYNDIVRGRLNISLLDSQEIEILKKSINDFATECLEESDRYGFKFRKKFA